MDEKKISHYRDVDLNLATDTMRQYLEIKNIHSDKIVLFQIGDFFETFFEDTKEFSEICDVVITNKKYSKLGVVPMAGFPTASLDAFVKRLLECNKKVVVATQFQDLKSGQWQRKIARIYTKGTLYEPYFLEADKNNYICAILNDGAKWGLSYCDISVGAIFATSGTREDILHEFSKINPSEVLVNKKDLLTDCDFINNDILTFAPDCFLSDDETLIQDICANAIKKYLENVQNVFAPKLDDVKKYNVNEYLSLDFNTRRSLELTRMQSDFKKRGSLFWFLNNTKTSMGARMLKNWMNSPLVDVKEISLRQKLIAKFFKNKNVAKKAELFLDDFCDVLRLTSRISNKTIDIKELLELSKSLKKVKIINEISDEISSDVFKIEPEVAGVLFDFSDIISRMLDEDLNEFEIYPIKNGVDAALDYSREMLKTYLNELDSLKELQKAQLGIEKIDVFYNSSIGYYYEIPLKNQKDIPQGCFEKQRNKSVVRYACAQLVELEQKITSTRFSAQAEKDIFSKLKEYSTELTFKIRNFANKIAYLDAIFSLYVCAKNNNFVCPIFNLENKFEIKDGKHPSINILANGFVPNSTNLNSKTFLNIVTGANMSGKSTYLKQNAIIAILAQMGSFVPAEFANLCTVDKIFFHGLIFDNLLKGTSSFMEEMKSIAYILKNATKNSLILFDEPIKGTNPEDSIKLCKGLFEYILNYLKVKTIAATHFVTSCNLISQKDGVEFFSIGEKEKNKLEKGISKKTTAFKTALEAGIPKELIDLADVH